VAKYILVHYTCNQHRITNAVVTVNGITMAKYIGIIFDQQLQYKAHTAQAVKKGTNSALALLSIAKCNWGTPFKHIRQLFQGVIAPRTDYSAIVWHRPKADRSSAGLHISC
jgi:hypothetical protein